MIKLVLLIASLGSKFHDVMYSFKRIVDYYTNRGSHVFVCLADFSKAFDRVNYWKLFKQLLDTVSRLGLCHC